MSKKAPFVFICNESKQTNSLFVDGMSGKTFRFIWNKDEGFYTYEPQSQDEVDDIMQSQFYGIYYFSIVVPGLFDAPEPKATVKPKLETKPESKPETASALQQLSGDELIESLNSVEDKDELVKVITECGGQASKRMSVKNLQDAAISAVRGQLAPEKEEVSETIDL